MILSDRIQHLAHMVTPCGTVADIGCDHCFTLIYLIKEGICRQGIGCDIKKGPLDKARESLKKYEMADTIELRLGNGLAPLTPGEADTAVISGMGGHLISDILNAHLETTRAFSELVLQPQLDAPALRRSLHQIGFRIADEQMVCEDGIYYTLLRALPGCEEYTRRADYEFGKILIEKKNPILRNALTASQDKNEKIIVSLEHIHTENAKNRLREIKEESQRIEEVLKWL